MYSLKVLQKSIASKHYMVDNRHVLIVNIFMELTIIYHLKQLKQTITQHSYISTFTVNVLFILYGVIIKLQHLKYWQVVGSNPNQFAITKWHCIDSLCIILMIDSRRLLIVNLRTPACNCHLFPLYWWVIIDSFVIVFVT